MMNRILRIIALTLAIAAAALITCACFVGAYNDIGFQFTPTCMMLWAVFAAAWAFISWVVVELIGG